MALTATEQLTMMSGETKPPSNDLNVLVHQVGFIFSRDFMINYKDFPTVDNTDPDNPIAINTEANSYLNKMLRLANDVFNNSKDNVNILTRILTTIIGAEASITIAILNNATDDQWSAFLLDNMDESFEYVAGVTHVEKSAYEAI